jgi:hypothetical protein
MKRITTVTTLAIFLIVLSVVANKDAWADRGRFYGHARIGIYLGDPWPWYWGYPAYYPYYPYYPYYRYPFYPPAVSVVPSSPPVYIEQQQRQEQQSAPSQQKYYWYYCSNPQGYYPYVRTCPAGWQKVDPQPPNQP